MLEAWQSVRLISWILYPVRSRTPPTCRRNAPFVSAIIMLSLHCRRLGMTYPLVFPEPGGPMMMSLLFRPVSQVSLLTVRSSAKIL